MTRFIPCLLTAAIAARVTPAAAQAPQASYTPADVRFMSGMIYHHAQAVLIAGWAPSHDAGPAVRSLCDRIVASQKGQIALLSRWLADRPSAVPPSAPPRVLLHIVTVVSLGGCASAGRGNNSTVAPTPDPRVGLKPGLKDAGQAAWNLKLVTNVPPSEKFVGSTNSDLAFYKNYVIQGNYNGYEVWDITTPSRPTLRIGYYCPASQSDVSVFRNLLFVSGEGTSGRLDCSGAGVHDSVSHDRLRGIRIFDIRDIANPKYVANVQTCRGSPTHTVGVGPDDSPDV